MTVQQYSRTALLLGDTAVKRLAAARVVVFGLGGVGSYTVEALSRGGVGALDLIDGDIIEESNINRQLFALNSTVGRAKVDVAAERIRDINRDCIVRKNKVFYLPSSIESAQCVMQYLEGASYAVDAVDTVAAKVGIITAAKKAGVPVISCMGTGEKIDPALLHIADISKTSVCPLARAVRRALRKEGIESGVEVVYSTEMPHIRMPHSDSRAGDNTKDIEDDSGITLDNNAPYNKRRGLCPTEAANCAPVKCIGSVSFVPSVAGIMIAGAVIRRLSGYETLR